jgi:diguanylate cyclase (GGDEF)-like protein
MDTHFAVVFTSASLQGAVCLLMALVLGRLAWAYRRRAIRIIALGWLALAVSFIASAASIGLASAGYAHDHVIRLLVTAIGLMAAYGQVALLIVGTNVVIRGRQGSPRWWLALAGSIVVVAVVSTLAFTGDPTQIDLRILVRIGLRNLVTGCAFVAGGLFLRQAPRPAGVGHSLVVLGFVLYGLQQLVGFAVTVANVFGRDSLGVAGLSTVAESIWLGMIGIGTVVWLLEMESDQLQKVTLELEGLTQVDQLTGAATRQRFLTSLARACRQARLEGHRVAVVAADVDGFRTVVTSLGRGASDELLRVLAERFRRALPSETVLARLERDEFALALPVERSGEGGDRLAHVIRTLDSTARPPFLVAGQEVYATVSIGAAVFPEDGDRPESVLRAAEAALEAAKESGPGCFRRFDDGLASVAWDRLQLETALRKAVALDQFRLHYQPVVRLPARQLDGFEALLRWEHPERGLLRPSEFLGSAEAIGVLPSVERWVLKEAAAQRRNWRDLVPPSFRLALNLSPDVFHQPGADEWILQAVKEVGTEPSEMALEITESRALMGTEQVVSGLSTLVDAGFAVALDDFGTGYSSLASLRQIPATSVKIDRSFVRSIDSHDQDLAFIRHIAGLAHAVDMSVVVEGVEKEQQAIAAHRAGCDLAQGHLFGLPVAAETATAVLKGQR